MADKTENEDSADKDAMDQADAARAAKAKSKSDDADDDDDGDDADDADDEPAPAKKPEPKPTPAAKKPAATPAKKPESKPAAKPAVKKPLTPRADKVKDTKGDDAKNVSKAAEPPKPVHIGGESFVDRVLPHVKKIMVAAVVIAVILTGVFAVKWWRHRKQERATEGIAFVTEIANRPVLPAGAKPDANVPSFANVKDRAAAVLAALDSEDVDMGHVFRGGYLLDAGQTDAAIAEFQAGRSDDGIDGVLCRENLGIAQEMKAFADPANRQKGLEEALETFKVMQPDDQGLRYAYALYHQGRLNITLTKFSEGRALLEKAKLVAGGTDLTTLISRQLEGIPQ
jgi:hypothetical protein